ncbi:MAG: hypothetical protein M3017_15270 [Actinomycetota bacterium]|nr:hypothetical protein [Actinomycetota bacterium]
MVINARIRGDGMRLAKLEQIGTQLIENSRDRLEGPAGENEYLAMIEG